MMIHAMGHTDSQQPCSATWAANLIAVTRPNMNSRLIDISSQKYTKYLFLLQNVFSRQRFSLADNSHAVIALHSDAASLGNLFRLPIQGSGSKLDEQRACSNLTCPQACCSPEGPET